MSLSSFLATTSHGLARATHGSDEELQVQLLLTDQDVRCLAADPLHPEIIYAGTQGNGVLRSDDGKENLMGKSTFWTQRRFTGITLILGSVLFLTGAGIPLTDSKGTYIYSLPPQEWLRVVYDHPTLWWWINVLFISGTVVALLGFALLTMVLRDAGNRAFSQLGLLTFELSAVFLIIHVAFHLTIDLWAAQETVRTSAMPDYYVPLTLWINAFFVIYTALVLVAFAAYGGALIFTRVLPRWIGWTIIVYSIAVMGVLVFTGDVPPLHPLLPLVMGILLLLRRYQIPARSRREESPIVVPAASGQL